MIDLKLDLLLMQEVLNSCKIEESLPMTQEEWANGSMRWTNMEMELESLPLTTSSLILKKTRKCQKVFKQNKINHCNISLTLTLPLPSKLTHLTSPAKSLEQVSLMLPSSMLLLLPRIRSRLDWKICMISLLKTLQ